MAGSQKSEASPRVPLALKVRPELKQRLDSAARESGRTQSQEAELRLEQSIRDGALLPELLRLKYGSQLAGTLLALGEAMQVAGQQSHSQIARAKSWMEVPHAYDEAARAAHELLEMRRPARQSDKPTSRL